jgi:MinD-like ATPase involved in chromosome partitioning or flagellar assembly
MGAISIKKRTLFVKENPYTQATQDLEQVARKLAKNLEKNMLINNEPNSRGLAGLFYRLVKHFN